MEDTQELAEAEAARAAAGAAGQLAQALSAAEQKYERARAHDRAAREKMSARHAETRHRLQVRPPCTHH